MARPAVNEKRRRGRRRLRVLMAACAVLFLLLAGALIDSALYYNKIHAGVTISGRHMSGLTNDEATATLTRLVEEAAQNPITLRSGANTWRIMPGDVGTRIDVQGAVSEAMDVSRRSNFVVDLFCRFSLYFVDRDVALQGTLDDVKLDELLDTIGQEIDVPPVDPGLIVDGAKVQVVEGQSGHVVDRDALRAQLRGLLLSLHATELEIPMVVKEPSMKVEDTQEAVAKAQLMISDPVALTEGDHSWSLTPEQIAAYMDFDSEDRDGVATLVPYLSAEKLSPFLEEVADVVDREPVNATFKGDGTQAWVVPAVPGRALDHEGTALALTAATLKSTGRTAQAAFKVVEPARTTEEAEAMGITDVLGEYTTSWEGSADRQTNVRITTKYASNVLLAPGEIYDFDKQIGPRTEERGYKMAPGITKGELEDQLGGGICQVSTTLFNAALEAGIEIIERHNHSIYIEHYPKGRDATVSAGGPNLRFRNDTQHYILVRGVSDGITTKFVIYGTDEGRSVSFKTSEFYDVVERTDVTIPDSSLRPGATLIKSPGQDGQSIKVVRTVKAKDGSVIRKDVFVSTWKMMPRQIEVGTSSTTTTQPVTTTTTQPASATTTVPVTASTPTGEPAN